MSLLNNGSSVKIGILNYINCEGKVMFSLAKFEYKFWRQKRVTKLYLILFSIFPWRSEVNEATNMKFYTKGFWDKQL